jgi:potassium channel subfamily K
MANKFVYRLTAINSISLVFALAANMALLLTMARRIRFGLAQGITIIGWYIASFLLIALVAACSTSIFRNQPAERHALSQAYYYAIIAAGLYFIIASMLVMTVVGAYTGHYSKEFNLSNSQRTLMLQTISFVVYLMLGALVYSYVEDWPFLDAVFWADFTLLTIGVGGEFTPSTHTGRGLLFPFAIGGIVMVGLIVGSVRSLALERGKQKLSARLMETKRESVLSSIEDNKHLVRLGPFEKVNLGEGLSETQRREREFKIMRRVQQKADRRRRYVALAMSSTGALLLWFLGALVFMFSEKPQDWTYFASLYFAYTTLLTIGYGDLTPSSNSGKPFFVFWTLLAVPTLTILISNMGDTVISGFSDLVIWLGSVTVLPNQGLMDAIKVGIRRLRIGKLHQEESGRTDAQDAEDAILDHLARHIEEDELKEAEEAGEHGDKLERDVRFYHFILAKEIRKLMKDTEISPPKQYTYNEWAYYLRLLGQDEDQAKYHRPPAILHERTPHDPDLGTANGGEGKQGWSWLGIRSPLMSNQTEARWILSRLTLTLEQEMEKMRSKKRRDPPPISMDDFKKPYPKDKEKNGGLSPEQLLGQGVSHAEVRRRQPDGAAE